MYNLKFSLPLFYCSILFWYRRVDEQMYLLLEEFHGPQGS